MLNSTPTIEVLDLTAAADPKAGRPHLPVLSIEKIVMGGYGLGRVGSQVLLVPGTIPGETLSVHIANKRRGVCQGEIRQIIESSADRIVPACAIAGQCGGCQFQHQNYESQVLQKRVMVQDALLRIGKLRVPHLPAVVPSPMAFHYRTTVRFVVFNDGLGFQLGFHKQGTRIPIQSMHCLLLPQPAKVLVRKVAQCLAGQRTLPVYLESLECRWSDTMSQGLLIFRGRCRKEDHVRALLELFGPMEEAAGFVFEFADSPRTGGTKTHLLVDGQDFLLQRLQDLTVRIGYRSFLQANWPVYGALVERLSAWGDDLKGQRILELYAGVGALGLTFAREGAQVTLVEANARALSDARHSATLNHIRGCRFRRATAETFLSGTNIKDYEALIVDPPRTGLSSMATQELGRLLIPRLFYVSCNPATLARDLSRLSSYGYGIRRIQPFDMFPQTAHIETLVELTL